MRYPAVLLAAVLLVGLLSANGQPADAGAVALPGEGSVVETADAPAEAEEPAFVKVDAYATEAAEAAAVTPAAEPMTDAPAEENATHHMEGHEEGVVPTPAADSAENVTGMYRAVNATAVNELAADDTSEAPETEGNSTVIITANATIIIEYNATIIIETNSTSNDTDPTVDPDALLCFVCNSHEEPLCSDPFDFEAAKEAGLLQQCGPLSGVRRVCRKQQQVIPGDSRTIRSCGHDNDSRDCYLTSEGLTASRVCHCMHDGCNGAGALQVKLGLAVVAMMVATAAWW